MKRDTYSVCVVCSYDFRESILNLKQCPECDVCSECCDCEKFEDPRTSTEELQQSNLE